MSSDDAVLPKAMPNASAVGVRARRLSTIALDVGDLAAVIADVGLDAFMDELIDVLRSALSTFDTAQVEHRVRAGFSYETPAHGLVEWMPTMLAGDVVSVKTVGYHPSNPESRGLPSVLATTALYDPITGSLSAICEATLLTALRTGAASALVTEVATRGEPITLGVVGAGAQAVTQIHAISRVRRIERLVVTDPNADVAESLAGRLPPGIGASPEVVTAGSFNDLVDHFDVICTCTSVAIGEGPVLRLSNARAGVHVNAVGADFPGKTELAREDLQQAIVIPDVIEQCLVEGECQQLDRDDIGPSLVDVLGGSSLQGLVEERTIFDSTGWSYEDLLAARLFLSHAKRLGLGTAIDLQRMPRDPYDPYETLRDGHSAQLTVVDGLK